MSDIVLYRCPTRTNVLCPCGAVARSLGKLELAYRTERVPYRRNSRPEIEELTRQRRVPVLVDGDEIVHDSKRIIQYLDWKYGKEIEDKRRAEKEKADRAKAAKKKQQAQQKKADKEREKAGKERARKEKSEKRKAEKEAAKATGQDDG